MSGINYSAHLYPSAGGYAGVVDVGAAYCQSIGADEGTRTAGAGSQRPYKFVAHCLDMTVGGHKKVDVSDPGVRSRVACSAYGQSRLAKYLIQSFGGCLHDTEIVLRVLSPWRMAQKPLRTQFVPLGRVRSELR